MPRANRYIQPGSLYHLTHRCHDRKFLFRYAVTRSEYQKRLRAALKRHRVPLLNYCITCNHTHLLVEAPDTKAISALMQQLEGEFAEWYNLRKSRSGAFWSDRYHCTMVDAGEYAWNCLLYVDLNMVRAGVVTHPREWRWCGYSELVGLRQRYRLIDREAVLRWQGGATWQEFARDYEQAMEAAVVEGGSLRNPIWTESIAVGSPGFTKRVLEGIRNRVRLQYEEVEPGVWTVREPDGRYGLSGDFEGAKTASN